MATGSGPLDWIGGVSHLQAASLVEAWAMEPCTSRRTCRSLRPQTAGGMVDLGVLSLGRGKVAAGLHAGEGDADTERTP